jgi:GTPase SAR1 family protein
MTTNGFDSFREKKGDVAGLLGRVAEVAKGIGAETLSARVRDEVVPKLLAERFHLVVVGEFNHGKTTMVNALVGRDILPTGVTPTTAVIHHILHAPEPYARVVREDESRETVPFDTLKEWVATENAETVARQSKVSYLEIGLPSKLLEDQIVLVDTPGVNDLSHQRADITYSYIPRSDAVLFLLDAGQLLKESERVFLFEKLLAKSRDKIIFVVTKADIWTPEERVQGMAYVTRELGKLVKEPVIFPVKAEQYLMASSAGDGANAKADSGVEPLLDHLSHFLAEERGRILLDHALGEGIAVADLLEKGVLAKRRALSFTREELDRRVGYLKAEREGQIRTIDQRRSAIREEIGAIKAWAKRDLQNFSADAIRQIPKVVDEAESSEVKEHLGAFLEATFKDWAKAETTEIATALEAIAERTVALLSSDAHDSARRLGEGLSLPAPSLEVNTIKYDMGVMAVFAAGLGTMFANLFLGGVLALAALPLALYVRGRVDGELREKAKEAAPAAIEEAVAKISPKIDEMIDDFAQRLDAWVVSAGDEIHREMLEVLQNAVTERDGQTRSADEQRRELERQEDGLVSVRAGLAAMRASLWTNAATPETATPEAPAPAPAAAESSPEQSIAEAKDPAATGAATTEAGADPEGIYIPSSDPPPEA